MTLNTARDTQRKVQVAKQAQIKLPNGFWATAAIEVVDAAKAAKYMRSNSGNRRIKKAAVNYFAALMRKGEWVLSTDAIGFDVDGKLLNGQHRLTAITLTEIAQPFLVVRGLTADAFQHIDTGNRRGLSDVLDIMGTKSANIVAALAKRVAFYTKAGYLNPTIAGSGQNSAPGQPMHADRADMLDVAAEIEEIQYATELATALQQKGRRLGVTPSMIGFVYLLYRSWHPGIEDFLQRSVGFTFDKRGESDPAHRLSMRLIDAISGLEVDRLSASARVGYMVIAANADFKGRTLSKLQWTHKDRFPQPLVHAAPEWAERLGWDAPRGVKEEGGEVDE